MPPKTATMNPETYRIPIDIAHKILATFGITRPTRAYERWVKDDGFDLKDFDEVLFESVFVFVIDRRAWLQDELETIKESLRQLDVELELELGADGECGNVACNDRRSPVAYRPNNESSFDDVIRGIQSAVPDNIEFRASPHNGGSDTVVYAVLPDDEWADLENIARDVVNCFFVPLTN